MGTQKSLGIYIHIPFCVSKCFYCDFCSFASSGADIKEKYTDELCRRIKIAGNRSYAVDTVYFGGGTPSLLSPSLIEKILCTLDSSFCIEKDAEITLECNPATADREFFFDIRRMGVNRLSMGLQSANENELRALGRAHGVRDFVACFEDARRAGFENISADLMYGIPEQTLESLMHSAEFLCDLSPEHISAYGLSIEEGTYFYKHRHSLSLADDDMQAEMYSRLCSALSAQGYERYEISNFARHGFESRHNTRYWRTLPYLGFGVAAHSYFEGERYGNSRDIDAFLRGEDICCEQEAIDGDEHRREYVMLGLRLACGIDSAEYTQCFKRDFFEDFDISKFVRDGFMTSEGGRVAFTERGFLVSNAILSELLC